MQYVIGFFIALFIALTGVGAGTVTVPVLVLFLGVPAPVAVGIGLMFATAVKLILVPAQIARKNVAWRTLGYMLLGGVPGVLVGSLFLKHLIDAGSANLLNAILGGNFGHHRNLANHFFIPPHGGQPGCTRPQPAALVAHVPCRRGGWFLICRSRSAGQRGAAQHDAASARASGWNRHRIWLCGFTRRQRCALVYARLKHRAAASSHRGRRRRLSPRNHGQHAHSTPSAAPCSLGLAADSRGSVSLQQLSRMGRNEFEQASG